MSNSGYPPPPPTSLQYAPIPAQRQMPLANPASKGIRLFRVMGISVYAHWSWLIFAIYGIEHRIGTYSSFGWNFAEFGAWVLIVLLHEFGHAFACRSVGGSVDRLMLWPLGGVAYVNPPPRPAPTLWSVAGGPLVNALLVPILFAARSEIPAVAASPDLDTFFYITAIVNLFLLVFNMLPFYPLDGGRILQCLLWFFMDQSRALFITACIGFIGVAGAVAYTIYTQDWWLGIFAVLAFLSCINAIKRSRTLAARKDSPRRWDFACPACGNSPPLGAHVQCRCGRLTDPFATQCTCPSCRTFEGLIPCQHCGRSIRSHEWTRLPWPTAIPMPPGYAS